MIHFKLQSDAYSINVPLLTFGTASFERHDNDSEYFSFLDKYLELGGSCIDSARCYCSWLEDGESSSEGAIGRWISSRGNRDKIILSTKGGHPNHDTMDVSRLSRDELEYDLNQSLKALQTDYIDIYFLHRDDEAIPVEEIMPILNDFVKSGKVHFIGASNWTTERIEKANKFAKENGMEPFRVSQIYYSLAHSTKEDLGDPTTESMDSKSYSWYKKNNFPVMAFSPQAKGFFSKVAEGKSITDLLESQFVSTANLAKLSRVIELSKETGTTPATVVLGYLNSQPFPVSSVFSVTKLWQLEEDMTAGDTIFDEKQLAFLENNF
ncbi:MAG: aldo/keto reductase [Clostridiales bacterium]|nr:aldo/keto reductase [Clostridiales bacterium]